MQSRDQNKAKRLNQFKLSSDLNVWHSNLVLIFKIRLWLVRAKETGLQSTLEDDIKYGVKTPFILSTAMKKHNNQLTIKLPNLVNIHHPVHCHHGGYNSYKSTFLGR